VAARRLDKVLRSCNLLLRCASWIVPLRLRADWRREWEAEVWHWGHFLFEFGRLSASAEQELLRHCRGAFADALWHRFNRALALHYLKEFLRTPKFCLLACLVPLAVVLVGRPATVFREVFEPASDLDSEHLLTVSLGEDSSWLQPEVLRDLATGWATQTPTITSDATYAWRPGVVGGPEGRVNILSARVTSNMFTLLGARPILGRLLQDTDSSQCADCVVVSNVLWADQFRGDEHVIGQSLVLNGRPVRVIGVMPPQFRFPVHDIGVYSPFGTNPHPLLPMFEWPGVLLRVSAGVNLETAKRQLAGVVNRKDSLPADTNLRILSLRDIEYQSFEYWAGLIFLSSLLLLAVRWRQFARLRKTGPHAHIPECFRWYLFFAAKTLLLLIAALVGSFEVVLAVCRTNTSTHPFASAAAIWLFLFLTSITVNWSFHDQFGRCRSCLRRLGVQVDIGNAARSLLELTGTELICNEGHGTLHVPIMESSCVDWERWTYLDNSWHTLVASQEAGISVS
jgi:hypothetical protein